MSGTIGLKGNAPWNVVEECKLTPEQKKYLPSMAARNVLDQLQRKSAVTSKNVQVNESFLNQSLQFLAFYKHPFPPIGLFYAYYNSVDCTWSEWTHGPCSVTCGEGSQQNTREMFPEMFGGKACEGEATETVICALDPCPGKKYKMYLLL